MGQTWEIPNRILEKVEELEKELERGWYCHNVCVRIRNVVGVRVSRDGGEYVATFYLSDYRAVTIVLDEDGNVKEIIAN